MRTKEKGGEGFVVVHMPAQISAAAERRTEVFHLVCAAARGAAVGAIDRAGTRPCRYPARAADDQESECVARTSAVNLIERGFNGDEETAIWRMVDSSRKEPHFKRSCDWLLLLLLGLVDALWVPRKGDVSGAKSEGGEGRSAYAIFTNLWNVLTFARLCYQLSRDPEYRDIHPGEGEALALDKFQTVSPHFVSLANA